MLLMLLLLLFEEERTDVWDETVVSWLKQDIKDDDDGDDERVAVPVVVVAVVLLAKLPIKSSMHQPAWIFFSVCFFKLLWREYSAESAGWTDFANPGMGRLARSGRMPSVPSVVAVDPSLFRLWLQRRLALAVAAVVVVAANPGCWRQWFVEQSAVAIAVDAGWSCCCCWQAA